MDRGLAYSSKICAQREHERRAELHKKKLHKVKPSVDTSEPRTFALAHVHGNLKKEQMLEERYTEIDRENRILLQKMSNIMKQPQSARGPGPTAPPQPRTSSAGPPRSLNNDARKKELLRITRENQIILKRIQQAQPVYNHVEWEGLNRRNMMYLRNSAEYPLVLRSARGRTAELTPLDAVDRGGPASARSAPPDSSTMPSVGQAEDTNKLVLSEKMVLGVDGDGASSGQSTFFVEMLTDGGLLRISAHDEDSGASLDLAVSEKSHRRLFREADGEYARIAQMLRVLGGRLVLDDPAALPPVQPPPAQPAPAQPAPALPQRAWPPPEEVEPEAAAAALEAKTPTPPASRPASRSSGGYASRPGSRATAGRHATQPRPTSTPSATTQTDDELDAAGLCRGSVLTALPERGGLRAEVSISYDPPDNDDYADVQVRLRGLTPSPDTLSGHTYDRVSSRSVGS